MLKKQEDHQPPPVYLPCWKCYGHKLCDQPPPTDARLDGNWVFHETNPVYCFTLKESIVPAAQGQDLECPIHGKIQIMHMAPDLVWQKCFLLLASRVSPASHDHSMGNFYMYTYIHICICIQHCHKYHTAYVSFNLGVHWSTLELTLLAKNALHSPAVVHIYILRKQAIHLWIGRTSSDCICPYLFTHTRCSLTSVRPAPTTRTTAFLSRFTTTES